MTPHIPPDPPLFLASSTAEHNEYKHNASAGDGDGNCDDYNTAITATKRSTAAEQLICW